MYVFVYHYLSFVLYACVNCGYHCVRRYAESWPWLHHDQRRMRCPPVQCRGNALVHQAYNMLGPDNDLLGVLPVVVLEGIWIPSPKAFSWMHEAYPLFHKSWSLHRGQLCAGHQHFPIWHIYWNIYNLTHMEVNNWCTIKLYINYTSFCDIKNDVLRVWQNKYQLS